MTYASTVPVPQTCFQIIMDAMVDAGKLGAGREPSSEDLATNMRRLNKLVNYLQTKSAVLWVQEDISIQAPTLQAGVNVYALGPTGVVTVPPIASSGKPRRVIEAYYRDVNASRRPVEVIARQVFDTYSTTVSQGPITAVYPDKQFNNIQVYTWMTPDAQAALGQLHLICDLQIPNFAAVTDAMVFPSEWALALEWGLAAQLCTGQPQSVIERCEKYASFFQEELCNWDVEDGSTTFQPDPRGQFVGKRFTY